MSALDGLGKVWVPAGEGAPIADHTMPYAPGRRNPVWLTAMLLRAFLELA